MREKTLSAIEEIESASLFARVGEPVDAEYIGVSSWIDAAESADQLAFDNYLLALSNELMEEVCSRSPDRYAETWNKVVDEIQERLQAAILSALDRATIPGDCRKVVFDTASWCLMKYCMECEYEDLVVIDHYHKIWKIFESGHFPCGIQTRADRLALMVF